MNQQEKEFSRQFKDNPNPKAKFGFIICYPFQFYVYKNIYKYLEEAEFIVDLQVFYPVRQPADLVEDLINILTKNKAYFRIFHYEDFPNQSYADNFFSRYTTLVSVWEWNCIKLGCNKDKIKVNLAYGAGKELITIRPSRTMYDVVLSYGERDTKLYSLCTKAVIVGNPKFDDWFNGEIDKEVISEINQKIDRSKRNILYLPTHSDLDSIIELSEELKKLSSSYNVIVKLHYHTVRDEKHKVDILRHKNIILLNDDYDLLPLLNISDIVISDNSSAIFDVILADKPIVVTDFLSADYFDTAHQKPRQYRRSSNAQPLTYSGSIEQIVKKEKLVPVIKKPEELENAIQRVISDPAPYPENRKKLREELFSFNDGRCGQRAAKEVEKAHEYKNLEKPILYHVYNIRKSSANISQSYMEADLAEYKKMVKEKIAREEEGMVFSVLLTRLDGNYPKKTIRSLIFQNFPANKYEIILPEGEWRRVVEEIIDENQLRKKELPHIKYVENAIENNENYLQKALGLSSGRLICFIECGSWTTDGWLDKFYLKFQEYSEIGGVGGYIARDFEHPSVFERHYILDVMKKLNIPRASTDFSKLVYEIKNNLFFQNPAGDIGNVCYKKEILYNTPTDYDEKLSEIFAWQIKKKCLEKHLLCFIPSPVYSSTRIDFKIFAESSFLEGMAFETTFSSQPVVYKKNKFTIWKTGKATLAYPLENEEKKAIFVIFIRGFFRTIGRWYMYLVRFNQKNKT